MTKVVEASIAFKGARAAAKASLAAKIDQMVHEETAEEMARLSVEMHKAFNDGTTKEQLRKLTGLYSSPLFDLVWDAVPYSGRDVKPGRVGTIYKSTPEFEQGRYLLTLVDNEHSELGKGILVTARDGEALPEPLNLPLYHVESTGKWLVRDLPDREMPDWWFDLMGGGGYAEFQAEVHEFASHEGVKP